MIPLLIIVPRLLKKNRSKVLKMNNDYLGSMRDYNQFVLWYPVQFPNELKPRKIPFNHERPLPTVDGGGANPHDPVNQLPHAYAVQRAAELGCGIGFALGTTDPFFCIDLDKCLQDDNTWSPFALSVVNLFPGALVEVSYSGNGLHIFGSAAAPEKHRNKEKFDTGDEIEVYTNDRFIAIGTQGQGDPSINHTPAFNSFLNLYLPGNKIEGIAWTTVPDPEWFGPADDADLIIRMLKRRPNHDQMFNGGVTVQDLWSANPEKLAARWPSTTPGGDYDHSSADAALCSHLAFWTGKDCARIDRLYRMSKLMRPKWDRGRDPYSPRQYLYETVTKACAMTSNVYKQPKETVKRLDLVPVEATPVMMNEATPKKGLQFLMVADQIEHFKGCIYIVDAHRVLTSDGSLLSPEQFKAVYGGYEFTVDMNNKTTVDAWEAFTRSRVAQFPKAHSMCFRPELPFGAIVNMEGLTLVNSYNPSPPILVEGDPSPFLDCIKKQFPDDRDRAIILAWAAACVQYKGTKFQWAPLIQGVEGNGKSMIMRCISKAVGEKYTHFPNAADLGNKFNSWILGKLFIAVEEVYVTDRREVLDALKPLITNDRIDIQAKGRDQFTGDNRANFGMCSNHKDAIMKTMGDRRYAVFYTAQQFVEDLTRDGMDGMYFPDLYNWLNKCNGYEIVSHFLTHYPIPDALNPSTVLHRAPVTSSTEEAIQASLGPADQEVLNAIAEDQIGFRGGWTTSFKVAELMTAKKFRLSPRQRGEMLMRLGFMVHPSLPQGKAPGPIFEEGKGRPTIYVMSKSEDLRGIRDSSAVVTRYTQDQGYVTGAPPKTVN